MGKLSQSYGATPAIWDHIMYCYHHPAELNVPHLNPSWTGQCWVDLGVGYISMVCHP